MKTVYINSGESKTEIKLPESLTEVSLNTKVAFDVAREELMLWLKDQSDSDTLEDNRNYYLYLMAKAVSEFIDKPLDEVLRFDVSDVVDDSGMLYKISFEDGVDIDSVDASLSTLYQYSVDLVDSYKFEFKDTKDFTFDYSGIVWEVPHVVKTVLGKKVFSYVSVAQAVEILQVKKMLNDISIKGDDLKNFRFSSFLKMLAIIVTKQGEEIPLDAVKYSTLIEERMVLFQEIDMKTAYDLIFFLINITMRYQK